MLHVPNSSFHTLPKLHLTSYLQSLVMVQNTLIRCWYTPVNFIYPCCGSPFVRSDSLSHLPDSGLSSSFSISLCCFEGLQWFFLEHSLGTSATSFSSSSPSLLPQLSRSCDCVLIVHCLIFLTSLDFFSSSAHCATARRNKNASLLAFCFFKFMMPPQAPSLHFHSKCISSVLSWALHSTVSDLRTPF